MLLNNINSFTRYCLSILIFRKLGTARYPQRKGSNPLLGATRLARLSDLTRARQAPAFQPFFTPCYQRFSCPYLLRLLRPKNEASSCGFFINVLTVLSHSFRPGKTFHYRCAFACPKTTILQWPSSSRATLDSCCFWTRCTSSFRIPPLPDPTSGVNKVFTPCSLTAHATFLKHSPIHLVLFASESLSDRGLSALS